MEQVLRGVLAKTLLDGRDLGREVGDSHLGGGADGHASLDVGHAEIVLGGVLGGIDLGVRLALALGGGGGIGGLALEGGRGDTVLTGGLGRLGLGRGALGTGLLDLGEDLGLVAGLEGGADAEVQVERALVHSEHVGHERDVEVGHVAQIALGIRKHAILDGELVELLLVLGDLGVETQTRGGGLDVEVGRDRTAIALLKMRSTSLTKNVYLTNYARGAVGADHFRAKLAGGISELESDGLCLVGGVNLLAQLALNVRKKIRRVNHEEEGRLEESVLLIVLGKAGGDLRGLDEGVAVGVEDLASESRALHVE